MPDEGEGEESIFLSKIVYVIYPWPLDPQERSDLKPIVAHAQMADAILIQTRESCKVPKPCRGSTLQIAQSFILHLGWVEK